MAEKQLHFEDVEVSTEIPVLVKKPTSVDLFMYSAVCWLPHRIHYDAEFAVAHDGLPGIVVHRTLQASYLSQMLVNWIGEWGDLKKMGLTNRAPAIPGDTLNCRGKVANKYLKDGQNFVECEIWVENQRGERITLGTATVALPSRI
jgi:hydroxyacyl-ACP dehydratase HTD2-like protein with hotdog domain